MIYAIQNEATGEIFIFSQDQVDAMLEAATDELTLNMAKSFLKAYSTAILNSEGFHFICYLGMRAYLGLKGVDQQQA